MLLILHTMETHSTNLLSVLYSGSAPYTGAQPGTLAPNAKFSTSFPTNFNGKVTTGPGDTSFIEFTEGFEQSLYDINNSLGELFLWGFTLGDSLTLFFVRIHRRTEYSSSY